MNFSELRSFGFRYSVSWRLCVFTLKICSLSALTGCGSDGLPLVPVEGRITFEGEAPPTHGSITFTPLSVEEGLPKRPGRASFDAQGYFRVSSFKDNDGLLPGRYQAQIDCWQGTPSSSDPSSFERLNYVPQSYQPPELVVEKGARKVEATYDVPHKK